MNMLLFWPGELDLDGMIRLDAQDRRCKHLRAILKAKPGQDFNSGLINGSSGFCRLIKDDSETLLRYTPGKLALNADQKITLLLALPRPQTLRKILLLLPQAGISRLILCRSRRVEKSFFQSKLLDNGEWRLRLLEGMEQACQPMMPRITIHEYFKPLIEDQLEDLLPAGSIRLCPDPRAASGFESIKATATQHFTLAIGPEGGWVDFELEKLIEHGFQTVEMGGLIQRVEIATCGAAARVDLLRKLA
jgi:16S rRNA (uracil1498-N3)-methyltransferase